MPDNAVLPLDRALLTEALLEARIGEPTDTPQLADALLPPLRRLLTEAMHVRVQRDRRPILDDDCPDFCSSWPACGHTEEDFGA